MNAIEKWISGKKTYITAGVILVVGILKSVGVEIPLYVWAALSAAGLAFLRSGVEKSGV